VQSLVGGNPPFNLTYNIGIHPDYGKVLFLGGSELARRSADAPDAELERLWTEFVARVDAVDGSASVQAAIGADQTLRDHGKWLRKRLVVVEAQHRIGGSCQQCR
jgi:hypothetical protein